jgi:TolB-like protein/Flp pilus assembly protein TadD
MERGPAPRYSVALKATAMVVLAVALIITLRLLVRPTIDPDNRTVVVMPFENLGNAADAYFVDGVSDAIANELAQLPGVKVIGREGVRGATVASLRPREVAATLGAQYVLSGTVRWVRAASDSVDGDARVQVVPVLTEVSMGERVWGQPIEERLREVFRVPATVAMRVADALAVALSAPRRAAIERGDHATPAARDALLRARALLGQRGLSNLRQAQTLFARAVRIDSAYAPAWSGLAESMSRLSAYGDTTRSAAANLAEAAIAAQRAMSLDSGAVEVRLVYARALSGQFRLADALRMANAAIALDSTSARAWVLKAELLEGLGEQPEAGVAYRQALTNDRLAPVVHAARARWFRNARMNDSAIASGERAVALAPGDAQWTPNLLLSYIAAGRVDDAVRECSVGQSKEWCTTVIRGMGGDVAAKPAARNMVRQLPGGWLTLSDRAVWLAQLGDLAGALATLQQALVQHDATLADNLASPSFDMLHDDPSWAAIVRVVRGKTP